MGSRDIDFEIKRNEYRQKHGYVSKSGRAKLIRELTQEINDFNKALEAERDVEAERVISEKNQDLAKFVFDKEARGKTSVLINKAK